MTLPSNERAKISLESKDVPTEVDIDDEEEDDEDQGVLIKNVSPAASEKKVEEVQTAEEPKEVKSEEPKEEVIEEPVALPVEDVKKESKTIEITPVEENLSEEEGSGPKVLGKINLDSLNLKTRPDKRTKKDKEKEV